MQQLQTLNDVFVDQLADLYSAEQQLVEALPKMANAASNDQLKQAFEHHLDETRDHVRRLQDILAESGKVGADEHCEGMQGLIREGDQIVGAVGSPAARDAALIGAAQRIEHYEIAAYGTARTLADVLEFDEARDLLDQTLNEESNADKQLTKIATGGLFKAGVNERAITT